MSIQSVLRSYETALNANDIDAAMKIIEGTARQMGITVSE